MKGIFAIISSIFLSGCIGASGDENNNPLEGNYTTIVEGSKVSLNIKVNNQDEVSGVMEDGINTYQLKAFISEQGFSGVLEELNEGIEMILSGIIIGNSLQLDLQMTSPVKAEPFSLTFQKVGSTVEESQKSTQKTEKSKERDPRLVGVWVYEQIYNSGYGYEGASMNYYETLVFLEDGRVFSGESGVQVSGSYFSGSSSGPSSSPTDEFWHTKDNRMLFDSPDENGNLVTTDAGRYFIDDQYRMMVTADNGSKRLWVKRK